MSIIKEDGGSSFAELSDKFVGQMFEALVCNNSQNDIEVNDVPLEIQKEYLILNINKLPIADRREIGNIIILNDRAKQIIECSEGSVINLDILPGEVIQQMYDLMLHKKESS